MRQCQANWRYPFVSSVHPTLIHRLGIKLVSKHSGEARTGRLKARSKHASPFTKLAEQQGH